jgi:Fe-S oxidoreductase
MRNTIKKRVRTNNYTFRRKTRGGEGKLEKAVKILKKSVLRDYATSNNYIIFYNALTKPNFPGNRTVQDAVNTIKDIAKTIDPNYNSETNHVNETDARNIAVIMNRYIDSKNQKLGDKTIKTFLARKINSSYKHYTGKSGFTDFHITNNTKLRRKE